MSFISESTGSHASEGLISDRAAPRSPSDSKKRSCSRSNVVPSAGVLFRDPRGLAVSFMEQLPLLFRRFAEHVHVGSRRAAWRSGPIRKAYRRSQGNRMVVGKLNRLDAFRLPQRRGLFRL